MTLLTKQEILDIVYSALSISKGAYGTHDGTPLYPPEYVRDVIFTHDSKIVDAIMRTEGHPRRSEYITQSSSIATPGVLVTLSGVANNAENRGILKVVITRNDTKVVVATPAPAAKITMWLSNKALYGDDACIDGYYDVADGQLIFTGASAVVHLVHKNAHTSADTNMFCPPEYKGALIRMALSELFGKDPTKRQLQQNYDSLITTDWTAIIAGDMVPPYQQMQEAR